MLKNLFSILALLLSLTAMQAQPLPEGLPQEYANDYFEAVQTYRKNLEVYDFALTPIEQIAIKANASTLNTGSWAGDYLRTNFRYDEIAKFTGKIAVFIFDTAGDFDHPMLARVKRPGKTFTGEALPYDGNGHGTHCAGIVGAIHPDPAVHLGVARMLPNLILYPYKVLTNGGGGQYTWVTTATIQAIDEAEKLQKQGYNVIFSYSLGGGSSFPQLSDAFKLAVQKNIIVVAAAGNTGQEPVGFPASDQNALAISALSQSGSNVVIASYSSRGTAVEFTAPGTAVLSTYKDKTLASLSGTSMACPAFAGALSVVWAKYPNATASAVVGHFRKHVTDLGEVGRDRLYGFGAPIIDKLLDNAIDGGGGNPPPPPPPPPVDPPTDKERELRTLTFDTKKFPVFWKPLSGTFRVDSVSVRVSFNTKSYDEKAFDDALKAINAYNSNRGYVLKDEHGLNDLAHWYMHFFDMFFRGQPLKLTAVEARSYDARGRSFYLLKAKKANGLSRVFSAFGRERHRVQPSVIELKN